MLTTTARLVSLVFHPLLILTYMLAILMLVNPYLFGIASIGEQRGKLLLLRVLLSSFFLPAFATMLLKMLGMIQSFEMKTREERYVPYIITGVFYLWLTVNFLNNSDVPAAFSSFMLGATIGLFIAFFINIFSKISAHTVGMGGLLGLVILTTMFFSYGTFTIETAEGQLLMISITLVLIGVVFLTGLVGTCRFLLGAHDPMDVYGGYLVGFSSQFIAFRILFS